MLEMAIHGEKLDCDEEWVSAKDSQKFSHKSRKILRGERSVISNQNHHGRRPGNTHNSVNPSSKSMHRSNNVCKDNSIVTDVINKIALIMTPSITFVVPL